MPHDEYRPRDHDHLVEPFLGAFAGERAPGPRSPDGVPPKRRGGLLLLFAVALVLVGALAWRLAGEGTLSSRGAATPSKPGPGTREGAVPALVAREPARAALRPERAGGGVRVVDDATDLPVADLVVVVQGDEERSVASDLEGRCALELEPGTVRFAARLTDGTEVALAQSAFDVRAAEEPLELRARIGPRYLVEIVGPPEARAAVYEARLVERVEIPGVGTREQQRAGPRPLEAGDPARVRFASPPQPGAGGALLLALHDATGEWSGSIEPPTLVGEPAEVLLVEVARCGVLIGRVVESGGVPVRGASVHLTPAGPERWPRIESDWEIVRTDERGAFRFERLEPGDHHLLIAPPFLPMLQRRVHVPAGTEDLGAIEVPGGGEKGAVAGVLKSTAGRGGICAVLQLESLDGTGWARSTIVGKPTALTTLFYGGRASEDAGEETEVAFRLDDVPHGRYRLVVVPWDARRYEPTEFELEAPTDDVVIWREDALAEIGFGFVVIDAESGATLPEFQARLHTRRWGKERSFPHRSGEVLGRVAPDGDLAFALFAAGYVPHWGDASLFAALPGDPRIATIALERGWGADFVVRDGRDPRRHHHRGASALSIDAPGEQPLQGVRVLADGVEVGVTDRDGRARVVLDRAPDVLTFESPGWITTPTTTFADGKVLHDCPSPKVWMVPAEPR